MTKGTRDITKVEFWPGSLESLQYVVRRAHVHGSWRVIGEQHQFREEQGAILNWWASGSVVFQGPGAAQEMLRRALLESLVRMGVNYAEDRATK